MATRKKSGAGDGLGSLASTVAGPSNGGVPAIPKNVDLPSGLAAKVEGLAAVTGKLASNSNKAMNTAA